MLQRNKPSNQVVGNAGLYYVCYKLSKRGWNVLPTSRNAKGVDIVIYDQSAKRRYAIEVKALSKRNPVRLGNNPQPQFADFLIICTKVLDEKPETYIAKIEEIKLTKWSTKDGKGLHTLETKDYEHFKDQWDKIGYG